jgi:hypothetical protein
LVGSQTDFCSFAIFPEGQAVQMVAPLEAAIVFPSQGVHGCAPVVLLVPIKHSPTHSVFVGLERDKLPVQGVHNIAPSVEIVLLAHLIHDPDAGTLPSELYVPAGHLETTTSSSFLFFLENHQIKKPTIDTTKTLEIPITILIVSEIIL